MSQEQVLQNDLHLGVKFRSLSKLEMGGSMAGVKHLWISIFVCGLSLQVYGQEVTGSCSMIGDPCEVVGQACRDSRTLYNAEGEPRTLTRVYECRVCLDWPERPGHRVWMETYKVRTHNQKLCGQSTEVLRETETTTYLTDAVGNCRTQYSYRARKETREIPKSEVSCVSASPSPTPTATPGTAVTRASPTPTPTQNKTTTQLSCLILSQTFSNSFLHIPGSGPYYDSWLDYYWASKTVTDRFEESYSCPNPYRRRAASLCENEGDIGRFSNMDCP